MEVVLNSEILVDTLMKSPPFKNLLGLVVSFVTFEWKYLTGHFGIFHYCNFLTGH